MVSGRQTTLIVWILGMFALAGLTVWYGAAEVGQAIVSVGWATLLVVLARAMALAGAGMGWWLLFPKDQRPAASTCVGLRFVREAANALLPMAQIGGDFIGARCLALRGVKGSIAAASVIVDVVMQASAQLVFAIVGLVLLAAMGGNEWIVWPIAIGVALAIPALAGFYVLQGERGRKLVSKLLSLFAGNRDWQVFGRIDELFARLDDFYRGRGRLLRGGVLHLTVWFFGATEVWIVLRYLGYPIDFGDAVIIESLMHGVRGAAFVVPGALGAQEGGLILLCSIFGVPPEAALALSLVKRIPDLVIGVPGLVAWQAMEGWHFHVNGRTAADSQK